MVFQGLKSKYGILILAPKMHVFWCFRAYNQNTETVDIVGSFRLLILANETHFFCCFRAYNRNTNVGSFRFWNLAS